MVKSDFKIVKFDKSEVVLIDLNKGNKSVTNDADRVIMHLAERGLTDEHRVFYRDSMKEWAEIRHYDGDFLGFLPVVGRRVFILDNIVIKNNCLQK